MILAFSVLCQEMKSYSVIGKQAGKYKGIDCALTGNLLAEIIHVLLLNWGGKRGGVNQESCQRAQTMLCPFLDLFYIKITIELRFLSHVAWKKEQGGAQILSNFFPDMESQGQLFP